MSIERLVIPRPTKIGEFDVAAARDLAVTHSETGLSWETASKTIAIHVTDPSFDVTEFDPEITVEPEGTTTNHATPWHVDVIYMNGEAHPTDVQIGSTEFTSDIVYGELPLHKSVLHEGPRAFHTFLETDEGQAAIEDALVAGSLSLDTELAPGDIARVSKFNAHRRKQIANKVPRLLFKDVIWEIF